MQVRCPPNTRMSALQNSDTTPVSPASFTKKKCSLFFFPIVFLSHPCRVCASRCICVYMHVGMHSLFLCVCVCEYVSPDFRRRCQFQEELRCLSQTQTHSLASSIYTEIRSTDESVIKHPSFPLLCIKFRQEMQHPKHWESSNQLRLMGTAGTPKHMLRTASIDLFKVTCLFVGVYVCVPVCVQSDYFSV